MIKNAVSSIFLILNILEDAAREPEYKEPKKERYCRHVLTGYRNGPQPIYF
jgi:hypothetical protein